MHRKANLRLFRAGGDDDEPPVPDGGRQAQVGDVEVDIEDEIDASDKSETGVYKVFAVFGSFVVVCGKRSLHRIFSSQLRGISTSLGYGSNLSSFAGRVHGELS